MKKKLTLLIALSSVVIAGSIIIITTSTATTTKKDNKPKETVVQIETTKEEEAKEEPPQQQEVVVLKTNEEIAQEVISGIWGTGEDRINRLTEAGYNPNEIQELVNNLCPQSPSSRVTSSYSSPSGGCLTKRGGVYDNPETGLHETWYSQRVLPGGGLKIPGRHVNEEGFVCDGDGYICLATNINQYPTGTIINTSRGIGKVYDHGCAWGTLDIYVDW